MAAAAAAEPSSSSASASAAAESYIGSYISLTSKSEIRYEGVLSTINTQESSIALRNVRSFGTEGRKKDGPQIPASDKIYEYILFRGSDIKDLQVKAPPPAQTTQINNDPAIIQSHYSHNGSPSTSLPTAGNGTGTELNSQTAQLGLPRSTFQGGLPLYQPGGSLGSWNSSALPPTANGSGLAMPMYWQGFYAPSGGFPHLPQPHLLHPPPGLPIPHSMQQSLQYSGMNPTLPSLSPNLADFHPPLLPTTSSAINSATATLPLTSGQAQASSLPPERLPSVPPETLPSVMENKTSPTLLPATNSGVNLPFVPPLSSSPESALNSPRSMPSAVGGKPRTVSNSTLAPQTASRSIPSTEGSSRPGQVESSIPLVTPTPSVLPPTQHLPEKHNDVLKPQEAKIELSVPEPSVCAPAEDEPILPSPRPTNQKPSGASSYAHHSNRGQGRGRRNGDIHRVTNYTEEFDFMAMNEKFNKDEVWGHLGKSKAHLGNSEELKEDDADNTLEEDDVTKPVYVKDDFFDSLSCNALDHGTRNGRTKFSEQLKIDTETFGNFPRHRPSRGGGRGFRGGRGRGSYYGRGYGHVGGGWGYNVSNRS